MSAQVASTQTPIAAADRSTDPLHVSLAERLLSMRGRGPLPPALLQVVSVTVRTRAGPVNLIRPRAYEELRAQERAAGRKTPHWARPWPCGIALADELAGWSLDGCRVLELGCGLGLPSIVAARRGATVLATDGASDSVVFAAHNLALAGASGTAACVDWVAGGNTLLRGAPWDLVLAADVLYRPANVDALVELLPQLLGRHGVALIADDNPLGVCAFRAAAGRQLSYSTRRSTRDRLPLHAVRARASSALDPWASDELVDIREDGRAWLRRQFDRLPDQRRRPLFERWFDAPDTRSDIAVREGLAYGQLLRIFNATAPLEAPVPFTFGGTRYEVVAMRGVCDDVAGERYGRFGEPLTLRVYLAERDLLPAEMLEAADWNFMGADRPGYMAYAYGTVHGTTVHLAALQSDLAARYTYLFQGGHGPTCVRHGDEVRYEDPEELVSRFGGCVTTLRRVFQRRWPDVVLTATCAWARTQPELDRFALMDFELMAEEEVPGHQMIRLYRRIPERFEMATRRVRTPSDEYHFRTADLADVERYVARWWNPVCS